MNDEFSATDSRPASLKGHLLIASPALDKGIFKSSVTFICEHSEAGAMGVIINRPSSLTFSEILEEFGDSDNEALNSAPVLLGGPVGMQRGFVLHQGNAGDWESSLPIDSEIFLTGSKDILRALAIEQGPSDFLLTLGYAGWSAGQLEQEILEHSWLTVPANEEILFNTPYAERFNRALALLGVDAAALATQGGSA